jgi:hypothetical protein
MRINISILRLLFFILLSIFGFSVLCAQGSDVTIPADGVTLPWLQENWEVIALILSEVAAILSKKYSGIIQSLIVLLTRLIKKK